MAVLQLTPAKAVLNEIEARSREGFLPIVGPVKGRLLGELIRKYQPRQVVEVGTLVGYSAILMGRHLPAGGKITTLEINLRLAGMARDNIRRAGLDFKIEVIAGDARETIPHLPGPFQLAFLDAAKEEYLDYLRLLEAKLPAGSVVVADNAGIFAQAMADYLHYVKNSALYRSRFHDFGFDGMEVSIKLM